MANIVLTDDHVLLRNGLASLVKSLGHEVYFEANNGKDLIAKLNPEKIPDIILLDINMPEMDGYETASWLKENHPEIKVLALTMYDNENAIIRMLNCGAKGYILKDSDPDELPCAGPHHHRAACTGAPGRGAAGAAAPQGRPVRRRRGGAVHFPGVIRQLRVSLRCQRQRQRLAARSDCRQ